MDRFEDLLESKNNILTELFGFSNKPKEEDLEIINEFSLGKFMEKRADKKAFKQQLKDTIVIDKKELSKYEKEMKDVVKSVQSIIKKEVPGCKFDDTKLSHHTYEKNGYEFNLYIMDIFTLNKDNFLKFASKSKNKTIMNAKTVNDCSKEIKKEVDNRLIKPIQNISGLSKDPDEPWYAVKNKDGKNYITIFATEEVLSTSIGLEAKVAVKLDD